MAVKKMSGTKRHSETLEQIRSSAVFSRQPFPRIGNLWTAELRKTEPVVVNFYAAADTKGEAFRRLAALVRKEEEAHLRNADAGSRPVA